MGLSAFNPSHIYQTPSRHIFRLRILKDLQDLVGKGELALEIIGREFGLEKYSSVSSIVSRTEEQLLKNKNMQNRIEEIRQMIEKGQAKICPPYLTI